MCYKIFFDSHTANLTKLFSCLGKLGEFIFTNGIVYIWLNEGREKKNLSSAMRRADIKDFYLQEINESNIDQEKDFPFVWIRERLNKKIVEDFENKHQEELGKMLDNIKRATEALNERISELNKKEGNKTDG